MEQFNNQQLDQIGTGWVMLIFGIAFLVLATGVSFVLITRQPPVADRCLTTPSGEIVPTRVIDGKLVFGSGSIFARTYDGKGIANLASCAPRGGCQGPFRELEKYLGRPVHAEFCHSTLVRVVVEQREMYRSTPQSQAELDLNTASARNFWLIISLIPISIIAIGVRKIRRNRVTASGGITA